jgi:hypothetical protein
MQVAFSVLAKIVGNMIVSNRYQLAAISSAGSYSFWPNATFRLRYIDIADAAKPFGSHCDRHHAPPSATVFARPMHVRVETEVRFVQSIYSKVFLQVGRRSVVLIGLTARSSKKRANDYSGAQLLSDFLGWNLRQNHDAAIELRQDANQVL